MIIDFRYRYFDSEIALYFYKKECKYDNFIGRNILYHCQKSNFGGFCHQLLTRLCK